MRRIFQLAPKIRAASPAGVWCMGRWAEGPGWGPHEATKLSTEPLASSPDTRWDMWYGLRLRGRGGAPAKRRSFQLSHKLRAPNSGVALCIEYVAIG